MYVFYTKQNQLLFYFYFQYISLTCYIQDKIINNNYSFYFVVLGLTVKMP